MVLEKEEQTSSLKEKETSTMTDNVIELVSNEEDEKVTFEGTDISFSPASVPGFMIEGLIGTAITQVFQQLNHFRDEHTTKGDVVKGCKALAVIAYNEAEQVVKLMEPMKDATLRPSHRAVRSITTQFLRKLEKGEKKLRTAKRRDNRAIATTTQDITNWLRDTTVVMSSYTKTKELNGIVKEWYDWS